MVVPRFVERALAGEPLEIFGDGQQTRCFCHVRDTIRALHGLMGHDSAGEIYNVGSTEQISIFDLAQRVIDATGSASTTVAVPFEEVYGRRHRGHAPPHPVDGEDPRGDRLAADARSRPRSWRT